MRASNSLSMSVVEDDRISLSIDDINDVSVDGYAPNIDPSAVPADDYIIHADDHDARPPRVNLASDLDGP